MPFGRSDEQRCSGLTKFVAVRLEKRGWICKTVEILEIYLPVGVRGSGKVKGKKGFEDD